MVVLRWNLLNFSIPWTEMKLPEIHWTPSKQVRRVFPFQQWILLQEGWSSIKLTGRGCWHCLRTSSLPMPGTTLVSGSFSILRMSTNWSSSPRGCYLESITQGLKIKKDNWGVPFTAQKKRIQFESVRIPVLSLAVLSGLGIWCCCGCGCGVGWQL